MSARETNVVREFSRSTLRRCRTLPLSSSPPPWSRLRGLAVAWTVKNKVLSSHGHRKKNANVSDHRFVSALAWAVAIRWSKQGHCRGHHLLHIETHERGEGVRPCNFKSFYFSPAVTMRFHWSDWCRGPVDQQPSVWNQRPLPGDGRGVLGVPHNTTTNGQRACTHVSRTSNTAPTQHKPLR